MIRISLRRLDSSQRRTIVSSWFRGRKSKKGGHLVPYAGLVKKEGPAGHQHGFYEDPDANSRAWAFLRSIMSNPGALVTAVSIPMFFGFYAYLNFKEAPFTNRGRILSINRREERELGESYWDTYSRQGKFLSDTPDVRKVGLISSRIFSTVNDVGLETDQEAFWECFVVDDSRPIAFGLPGKTNRVVISTGAIEACPSDECLAFLIAHEAAHVLLRHSNEYVSKRSAFPWLPFDMVLRFFGAHKPLHAHFFQGSLRTKMGRDHETEADYYALQMMKNACFNPDLSSDAVKLFESSPFKSNTQSLGRHSYWSGRSSNFAQWIPGAVAHYDRFCIHRDYSDRTIEPPTTPDFWSEPESHGEEFVPDTPLLDDDSSAMMSDHQTPDFGSSSSSSSTSRKPPNWYHDHRVEDV
eukprot:TRINITY_DN8561_c0_g1::TRINITY_DN8561_c0_g1_i1::g.8521::m.8521 TRINITY_DN8561_c0_g1::TRINITY_DN8561_c0_g1_i1::g.8521  ORF type:complete len:425 (-),score=17.39,sp/P36163/OMA1_YEAST/27.78/1e-19,Peptidase_M48/PF01435.13/5.4e-14,DUF955/PF06114.8/0.13,Peptidase_U49/PF10463.4/9.1,Peptidase_U49/PF10463.4/63 TRINITY_DN8561_c0_g1_i1:67-1296(-)